MDAIIQNGIALNPKSVLEKVDSTPTTDSENLISSGGVKQYVDQKDAATNERIDTVNTQLASSFFFKGSSTYASLPVSGNTINDTYYVTDNDKQCWYSWDGTSWIQSSMSQADYAGLIAQLKADMSSEFSQQKTYDVGDFCLYGADGKLYVCKTAITTTGAAWDSTKWDEVAFADAISDLILATDTQPTSTANKIWLDTDEVPDTVEVVTVDDLSEIVTDEFDQASAYSTGDYVMYDAKLYKANTASAANDGWVSTRWQEITVMNEMKDELTDVKNALDTKADEKTADFVIDETFDKSAETLPYTAGNNGMMHASAGTGLVITGTHNKGLYPMKQGTFVVNGVTFVVDKNTITVDGTAEATIQFSLMDGAHKTLAEIASEEYVLPEGFTWYATNKHCRNDLTIAILSRKKNNSGTIAIQDNIQLYDNLTWGGLYIYVSNGTEIHRSATLGFNTQNTATYAAEISERVEIIDGEKDFEVANGDYIIGSGTAAIYGYDNKAAKWIDDTFRQGIQGPENWIYYGTGYFNDNGSIKISASQSIYYIVADADFDIWTDDKLFDGGNDCYMAVYSSATFGSDTLVSGTRHAQRKTNGVITADTMPKSNSKLHISAGQYLAVSIGNGANATVACKSFMFYSDGGELCRKYMAEDVVLDKNQIDSVIDSIVKPICFKTENEVCAYIPTSNQKYYIKYRLVKVYSAEQYADGWRISEIKICNLDKTQVTHGVIMGNGEWETALVIPDGSSTYYAGLGNHGYEEQVSNGFHLYVDGKEIDDDAVFSDRTFEEIQLYNKLEVLDPRMSENPDTIAYNTRIDTINGNKKTVTVSNKLDFINAESIPISEGFMFMSSFQRTYPADSNNLMTDAFIDNEDYVFTDCSSDTYIPSNANNGVGKHKTSATEYKFWGSYFDLWGYAKILNREVHAPRTADNTPYNQFLPSTYVMNYPIQNKLYMSICENGNAIAGDIWKMETEFFLDCGYNPQS